MKKLFLLIAVLSLAACGKQNIECHSEDTANLIKKIIWNSMVKEISADEMLLDEQEFKRDLFIDYARATGFEEKIHKYSCAATIRYRAAGLSEFGRSLEEGGTSKMAALRAERKASVRAPLRYSALSYLSDSQMLLSHLLKNSDAFGYSFETEFSSQQVGTDHYAEVSLSRMNSIALYAAAALSKEERPAAEQDPKLQDLIEDTQRYNLSDKEKSIIKKSLENLKSTYSETGVAGVIAERDQCYQAAAGIKEPTLTLQCIAYDYASSTLITTIEASQNFPITPGFTKAEAKIRALESVENTMSQTLNSKKMRDSFLDTIEQELN